MSSFFRTLLVLLVGVTVVACASTESQKATAQSSDLLYVCNQGSASVSVIDTQTLEIVKTIDLKELGFSPTAKPHHIAVLPDGSWFLSLIGDNKVLKFGPDDKLIGSIDYEVPGMLIYNKPKNQVLVGRSMSAVNPPMRIGFIDPEKITVEEIDIFYPRPHALNVHPNGEVAYSASLAQNSMGAISTDDGSMKLKNEDGKPNVIVQFAVAPDGMSMIGTSEGKAMAFFYDLTDPLNPTAVDSVSVEHMPWHPIYSPDGKRIFFGNKMMNTVTVLDAKSHDVLKVIKGNGISEPHGSALSVDGKRLFISNNNLKGGYKPMDSSVDAASVGTVVVINTDSYEIEKVIEVGANATGLSPIVRRK